MCSWSFDAFLKSREYPARNINTTVTDRRSSQAADKLFSDSQVDKMDVRNDAGA